MAFAAFKSIVFELRAILLACSLLAAVLLNTRPSPAQAEINPDHYDTPNTEAVFEANARPDRGAPDSQGTFTPPLDVNCAGLVLPAGFDSLSVPSAARSEEVTLTRVGSAVRSARKWGSDRMPPDPGRWCLNAAAGAAP